MAAKIPGHTEWQQVVYACSSEIRDHLQQIQVMTCDCCVLVGWATAGPHADAWADVVACFQPLVRRWVQGHRLREFWEDGPLDRAVDEAFSRMYSACTGQAQPSFANFYGLCQYIWYCVDSLFRDRLRQAKKRQKYETPLPGALQDDAEDFAPVKLPESTFSSEERYIVETEARRFWEWVQSKLIDDAERLVVYERFVLDRKPLQIHLAHPDVFESVREVYRIKERVMSRMRSDPASAQFDFRS